MKTFDKECGRKIRTALSAIPKRWNDAPVSVIKGGWRQRTNQDTGEHDRGACPKVETGRTTSFFVQKTKMNGIRLNPDRIHPPSTYRPPPRAIFSSPFFLYFSLVVDCFFFKSSQRLPSPGKFLSSFFLFFLFSLVILITQFIDELRRSNVEQRFYVDF